MGGYCVIELTENFKSNINDRDYSKGEMVMVWEDSNGFRVVNNNMDYIPCSIAIKRYEVRLEKIS